MLPKPIPREDSREYTDIADEFRRNITSAIEDTIDQETQVGAKMCPICADLSLTFHLKDVTVTILNIGPNNDERRLMGGEVQGGTVEYQATIIMENDFDNIFALFRAIEENVETATDSRVTASAVSVKAITPPPTTQAPTTQSPTTKEPTQSPTKSPSAVSYPKTLQLCCSENHFV